MTEKRKFKAHRTNISVGALLFFSVILIALVSAYGYVSNMLEILYSLGGPVTAMFIARCVGVVAIPLGAVLGFF